MLRSIRSVALAAALVIAIATLASARIAEAATAGELDRDAKAALETLYAREPSAKLLGQHAKGILVFPGIVKAGFMFGGQIGEGALLEDGKTTGYYNSVAASYGFQAGVQKFGYALFFMNDQGLADLKSGLGFELGMGPSIVVVDAGIGKSLTTKTIDKDIYAFIFSQKGLMAGVGLQGSKLTKISK